MMIFSKSSISSRGRSAVRKDLTVMETSSGSVHSGRAVAIIYDIVQYLELQAWKQNIRPGQSKHACACCQVGEPEPRGQVDDASRDILIVA